MIAAVSRAVALGSAAAVIAACVPHTPPSSPAAFDHTWQIVGHRFPGVSAIGEAEAAQWHGRFLHLQAHRAGNGVAICDAATYREHRVQAGPFLDTEYRIPAAALGVPADASAWVIEVQCEGQPWTVLGGRILSFGAAGEFAVWDGVFFVLRRVHL